jgi:predicted ribosome quality control (RQC) complex YloA/Tae2 family protein
VKNSQKKAAKSSLHTLTATPLPKCELTLSASELRAWCEGARARLLGARVERVLIPACVEHPEGYFKKEWVLDLHSPTDGSQQLYFTLRAQEASVVLFSGRSLRAAGQATRSGFDLGLAKNLEGRKISSVTTIENDRAMVCRFQNSAGSDLELIWVLIPAHPEAALLEGDTLLAHSKSSGQFVRPAPRVLNDEATAKIPFRAERVQAFAPTQDPVAQAWLEWRSQLAFGIRKREALDLLHTQAQAMDRKKLSFQEQWEQSQTEPNWGEYGSTLQAHYYLKPKPIERSKLTEQANPGQKTELYYALPNLVDGSEIQIPADGKLDLQKQMEKFFNLERRKRARLEESRSRIQELTARIQELQTRIERVKSASTLEALFEASGQTNAGMTSGGQKGAEKKLADFTGKRATSKEGLTIVAGRNLKENLEVTFKIARGNDLWLHVRGRPGSHTVILLPPKRSASLDTLLDAAHLCILFSGGKDWGKTEVDYTYRKFVKKIKNQTEVSYTNNKTLVVDFDPKRPVLQQHEPRGLK